jgi:hypothetical protein
VTLVIGVKIPFVYLRVPRYHWCQELVCLPENKVLSILPGEQAGDLIKVDGAKELNGPPYFRRHEWVCHFKQ